VSVYDHLVVDVVMRVSRNLTHIPFREFHDKKKGDKRRFLRTLWHLAAPTFVPAGFCQLVTVFAQVAIPVMVRELLQILEDNPSVKVIKEGMPFAILIFVAALINAFADHRHRYLATKTGVVLRASLVNVIYDNALRLTPEGRAGLTSGQVTTLVAVDTQKVRSVLLYHWLVLLW
jgi:ABC-type multidrug transport system fused ATPase/permease subunit